MHNLTASMQDYIRTVYELSPSNQGVRVSDVAAKLDITKASACIAMKTLGKMKLVCRDEERLVFCTEAGTQQAILLVNKRNIIRHFLIEKLSVNPVKAELDACAIEHVISLDTLCAICQFNQKHKSPSICTSDCPCHL